MNEDKSLYITIIIILLLALVKLYFEAEELEKRVDLLIEDSGYVLGELRYCMGEVKAYDRAFDYHIVMSELGIYPSLDKDLFLDKKKPERKQDEQRNKNKN